jgi:hypothetical protein
VAQGDLWFALVFLLYTSTSPGKSVALMVVVEMFSLLSNDRELHHMLWVGIVDRRAFVRLLVVLRFVTKSA